GKITGIVMDSNGEPLYAAIVRLEENTGVITQTDFDGKYSLTIPDDKSYTVRFSLVGYQPLFLPFSVNGGKVINKDVTLLEEGFLGEEIEIIGKATRANDSYMEKQKLNSSATLDYISSETIKKTGDSNVINAVARVSGVSTSGGLITVRGIGDRYVRTTMNGSRIATLDPLTNNIQLDIFPNTLVDNIIITKTASPELPGDWSGAYISVETKDFPDKLTIGIETQIGYNPQVTFKDFATSETSKTDWLGFDTNLRNRETSTIVPSNLNPSIYDQFVAFGLGEYFSQLGISKWNDGDPNANTYFKLGLVQLGLLAPALIDDPTAFSAAQAQYNATYKPQAIQIITPDGTNYDNGFSNSWDVKYRKAPTDFSQSFSIGNSTKFFGRELGLIAGFKYNASYRYDPNGISQRVSDESLGYIFTRQDEARIGREVHGWSALINAHLALNANNKVSFLFMPNFIGTNDVASYRSVRLPIQEQELDIEKNLFYEQRRQLINQFSSEHFIPKSSLKITTNASYTLGKSIAPDFKALTYSNFVFGENGNGGYSFGPTSGDGIRRFYRYLTENTFDSRLDFDKKFKDGKAGESRRLKWGAGFFNNYRKIDNYEYRVMFGNNNFIPALTNDDIDAYMSDNRFTVNNGIQDYNYMSLDFDRNHSFGYSNVYSTYLATDWDLTRKLRFSGGVRAEYTDILTDVDKFHRLGYAKNDVRRENVAGFPLVNPAEIKQLDLLPSVNLIFKLKKKENEQTNLRLNYSRSLARPSIRELSDAAIVDNEFRTLVYGNSDLKVVRISNYDLRFESYFKNGDNFSVSLFYKDIKNHIELGFGSTGITWENIAKSSVRGVEFEGKKNIGKHLELRANVTIVESRAEFVRKGFFVEGGIKQYTIIDTLTRPMFGQAPYLINAIMSYTADSLGLVLTASYNRQGQRLVIAGVDKGRPDVYEQPRNMIDIKISKKLGDHFQVSLTMRDILNTRVSRSYDLPDGDVYFDSFRYGTSFLLGISYKY
ncbi:MAG: TonB-dependent receptor domain-containing protein, partial [Flavobacteriales bacterium]